MITGRVVERTFKSGETVELAEVEEHTMRLLYTDHEGAVFMDDNTFEQLTIFWARAESVRNWLLDDLLYDIILYKGEAITIDPPTFLELKVVETAPGARGDTASGRVLKPAKLQTGAQIQIPIFIDEGELIKVDTRTGDYVSRASK
jgi:elongation factor P